MSYKVNSFITSDTRIQDGDKKLSICLSANGFSFSVISLSGKLLAIGDVDCDTPKSVAAVLMQLREIFGKLSLNLPSFAETEVIEPVAKFTLIPEHLYKKGTERQCLELVCTLDPKDEIKVEYSEKMQAYCLFVTDSIMVPALKILAPKIKHRCQHTVLAESSHIADRSKGNPVVSANLRSGYIDVAVFSEQRLLMTNTFSCTSTADAEFMILSVIRNLQLRKDMAEVMLSGQVDKERYQQMRPFFAKLGLNTGRPVVIEDDTLRRVHIYKYALTIN